MVLLFRCLVMRGWGEITQVLQRYLREFYSALKSQLLRQRTLKHKKKMCLRQVDCHGYEKSLSSPILQHTHTHIFKKFWWVTCIKLPMTIYIPVVRFIEISSRDLQSTIHDKYEVWFLTTLIRIFKLIYFSKCKGKK